MKRIFLAAAMAVLALSSCSKNEVAPNMSESNKISFDAYTGISTKAAVVESLETSGFYVWANYDATSYASYFSSIPFSYDNSSSYSGNVYWPGESALNFFMMNSTDDANNVSSFNVSDTGVTSFTYTTADGSTTPHHDLVYSALKGKSSTDYSSGGTAGQAELTFKHALSKVGVHVKADTDLSNLKLAVTSIKFNDLLATATATLAEDADLSTTDLTWAESGSYANTASIGLADDMAVSDNSGTLDKGGIAGGQTSATDATADSGYLFMIPNNYSSSVTITVQGQWYEETSTGVWETFGSAVSATTDNISANWVKGTAYQYNVSLTPSTSGYTEITFTVSSIESWGNATENGASANN
ncbi:MAG: hypothetical protein SNJ33_07390 [Rikenellaceae bacterium]